MNAADRELEVDRRRAVLAMLAISPGYRLPVRSVRGQLEILGYSVSLDRVATDCAWLAEQGLVEFDATVVTLTERGMDVVMGRVIQPGVRRPEPGEL